MILFIEGVGMEQKEAYNQGRRQALLDAVILVRKYFTDEMNALPVNKEDEIIDMPTCNRILKYSKDICTELRKMVPQEVEQ